MADKPFMRVKDKSTKHEYDVHEQAFDPERHTELKRKDYPRSATPRRPKHHVSLTKSSPETADEGDSPDGNTATPTQGKTPNLGTPGHS